jgi:predicted small lipoprotein YifL
MKKIGFICLTAFLVSVLVACGQTGSLVLPSKKPTPTVNP